MMSLAGLSPVCTLNMTQTFLERTKIDLECSKEPRLDSGE